MDLSVEDEKNMRRNPNHLTRRARYLTSELCVSLLGRGLDLVRSTNEKQGAEWKSDLAKYNPVLVCDSLDQPYRCSRPENINQGRISAPDRPSQRSARPFLEQASAGLGRKEILDEPRPCRH